MFKAQRLATRSARQFSTSTVARSGHYPEGPRTNIPFTISKSKPVFATKLALFFATGFSIPFLSAYWQLSKKD
ncbi:cytochrome c oxidase subunit VIIc [Protomyces lactucae-debilis]|uniref:Cytochrome c oxidase subunit 8, mitochondrial n=1 Tax=Protomyces lactucae-debilis TaxID=2754530 RepID=A0A1Y2ETF7_PROLT|nr:cytochrome c oxidase subunit VIIc [Protomyces lactucae-debilis]ORY74827.1 cytochrome c oxidase subunit VIIc [Protomyces lactucae-debilis]